MKDHNNLSASNIAPHVLMLVFFMWLSAGVIIGLGIRAGVEAKSEKEPHVCPEPERIHSINDQIILNDSTILKIKLQTNIIKQK